METNLLRKAKFIYKAHLFALGLSKSRFVIVQALSGFIITFLQGYVYVTVLRIGEQQCQKSAPIATKK